MQLEPVFTILMLCCFFRAESVSVITDLTDITSVNDAFSGGSPTWTFLAGTGNLLSTCASNDWLGGPGELTTSTIYREYSGLDSHYALDIQYSIYFGDNWNGQGYIFQVDTSTVTFTTITGAAATSDCGDPGITDYGVWTESKTVTHSLPTAKLTFQVQDNGVAQPFWWAVRAITVTVVNTCFTGCATCNGPDATNCLSCVTTYFLDSSISSCVQACPAGMYGDPDTNTCASCTSPCAECSGSASSCTVCIPSYYLDTLTSSCGTTCPLGYYGNDADWICYACTSPCATCSGGPTNCITCIANYYIPIGDSGCNDCLGPGYSLIGVTCYKCDSSCLTCDNILPTSCTSCTPPLHLYMANQTCMDCDTNLGVYYSGVSNQCLDCSLTCADCSGDPTNCILCNLGTYLLSTGPSTSTCDLCTMDYYYISGSDCLPCSPNCKKCSGTATTCTACEPGLFLYAGNQTCTLCNEDGFFQSGSDCLGCHSSCKTCYGPLEGNCITCNPVNPTSPYFLASNTSCIPCQGDKFYLQSDNINCDHCHTSCLACNGPLPTQCLSCNIGYFLNVTDNACTLCNTDGYYKDSSTSTCRKCDLSCRTCNGSSFADCTSCYTGNYLKDNSTCTDCVIYGYFIQDNFYCSKCASTCVTCYGTQPNNCLSCTNGLYLIQGLNTCGACNLQGYYAQYPNCLKCSPVCQNCSGPSEMYCTSCNQATDLYLLSTGSGTTCSSCKMDYYYRNGGSCSPCHTTCQSCRGETNQDCIKCKYGYYYNPFTLYCETNCASPYVLNSQTLLCEITAPFIVDYLTAFNSSFLRNSALISGGNNAVLLANVTSQLTSFVDQMVSDGFSGCPRCSGSGTCTYKELYLSSKCDCDEGWQGDYCSIESNEASKIEKMQTQLMNYIENRVLSLKVNSVGTREYLEAMLNIVSGKYVALNVSNKAVTIINSIITRDYSTIHPTDVFDPSLMQLALQVLDSSLQNIYNQDCGLTSNGSGLSYNNSISCIEQLGLFQLWGKNPSSTQYTLNSSVLQLGSKRITGGVTDGTFVFKGTPPPQVILEHSNAQSIGSTQVDLHVAYATKDLYDCPYNQSKKGIPPPVSVWINNAGTSTKSNFADDFSASLIYPLNGITGSNITACQTGCTVSTYADPTGIKMLECDCPSISSLKNVPTPGDIFSESNLSKLLQFSALQNYDYLHSAAFWLLWVLLVWYLTSVLIIKFNVISPLKYQIPRVMREFLSLKKLNIQQSVARTMLKAFCYGHAFVSIYFYEDRMFPRIRRLTLMYCRFLILGAFSSIFNKSKINGFLSTLIMIMLPFVTVLPINTILRKLIMRRKVVKLPRNLAEQVIARRPEATEEAVREEVIQIRRRHARKAFIKEWTYNMFGYFVTFIIMCASIYTILVVAANSDSEDSKNWAVSLIITVFQDMGTSQMLKVALTGFVLKLLLKLPKNGRKYKLLKKLLDKLTVRAIVVASLNRIKINDGMFAMLQTMKDGGLPGNKQPETVPPLDLKARPEPQKPEQLQQQQPEASNGLGDESPVDRALLDARIQLERERREQIREGLKLRKVVNVRYKAGQEDVEVRKSTIFIQEPQIPIS